MEELGRKHWNWNKVTEMAKWKKERGGGKWERYIEKKAERHSCSQTKNFVQITILPKLFYKLSAIPLKTSSVLLHR